MEFWEKQEEEGFGVDVVQRKNWCTQYFRESRIKVKTNICEHNNFLNPDLR